MENKDLLLFAPEASRYFSEKVARRLGLSLSLHEEREFEDGEHKIRPLVSVRGKDVFVIQSLFSEPGKSVNDKLCRFLFFLGALRDASAARITAVIPYLGYARKDRRSQPRDPLTCRYIAQLLEGIGVNHVVTMDVHNIVAFQNAFRCTTDHLEAANLFVQALTKELQEKQKIAVISPDPGGVKRAEALRQVFERRVNQEVELGFLEKMRAKGVLRTGRMIGDVRGRIVVIVDDLISTGRTLVHAAKLCKEADATKVYAAVTHGIFAAEANEILKAQELDRVLITDTVPPVRLNPDLVSRKIQILPASDLFAEAILRIHRNGSIVDLLSTI